MVGIEITLPVGGDCDHTVGGVGGGCIQAGGGGWISTFGLEGTGVGSVYTVGLGVGLRVGFSVALSTSIIL